MRPTESCSGRRPAPPVGPTFSTSQSPIVDRGLVIAHVGGNNKGALTAFDVNTGAAKWQWTGDGPGYGSPIITEFGGVRQVVTFTQQNLVGVSAETGELLWQRQFKTPNEINALTPLVYGGMLIVSGQDQGVQALRVARKGEQWTVEDVWRNDEMWFRLSNGIVVRDAVFGLATQNSGHYFFVDAKTGKTLWKGEPRAAANAAIMKSGDLLFVLEDDGGAGCGEWGQPDRLLANPPLQGGRTGDLGAAGHLGQSRLREGSDNARALDVELIRVLFRCTGNAGTDHRGRAGVERAGEWAGLTALCPHSGAVRPPPCLTVSQVGCENAIEAEPRASHFCTAAGACCHRHL